MMRPLAAGVPPAASPPMSSRQSSVDFPSVFCPDALAAALLRYAPIGIAIKSPDGRYVWANDAAARLIGSPAERIRGMTDAALFPAMPVERLRQGDSQVLERGSALWDELELRVGGSSLHCRMLKFRLEAVNGGSPLLGVFMIEHSAEAREYKELREMLERLERSNRELRAALDEMNRLASTDKLTGAWNRRRLEDAVADEMHRLERYGHPVSLILLDIDHFKAINDAHGHAGGDAVLVHLASMLRGNFRRSDSLSRWGGEEFIVLCPHTRLSMARSLAERLRKNVASASFPAVGRITVSIGVAECLAGETWDRWFQRADEALLRAKKAGRNRVHAAPETMRPDGTWRPTASPFPPQAARTSDHPGAGR